jgi:hypothetical protein
MEPKTPPVQQNTPKQQEQTGNSFHTRPRNKKAAFSKTAALGTAKREEIAQSVVSLPFSVSVLKAKQSDFAWLDFLLPLLTAWRLVHWKWCFVFL